MAQCQILLVDDEPQIRSFVEAALKARKYFTHQAIDGVEALELLQALGSPVDLLITDIKMPRRDGVALAVAEMFPACRCYSFQVGPIRSRSRSGRSPDMRSFGSHFCRRR